MLDKIWTKKYIQVTWLRDTDSGKTSLYGVTNKINNATLGRIKWWAGWRKYVFSPYPNTIYDANCLMEIMSILDQLTVEHKNNIAK